MKKKPEYEPDTSYIVTAKFEMPGREVDHFLLKLKRAKVKWVSINRGRYV